MLIDGIRYIAIPVVNNICNVNGTTTLSSKYTTDEASRVVEYMFKDDEFNVILMDNAYQQIWIWDYKTKTWEAVDPIRKEKMEKEIHKFLHKYKKEWVK